MTIEELKILINENITNKTERASITPTIHGATLMAIVDFFDAEISQSETLTPLNILGDIQVPPQDKVLPDMEEGQTRIYLATTKATYTTTDGSQTISVADGEKALIRYNGEQWEKETIDNLAQDISEASYDKAASQYLVKKINYELTKQLTAITESGYITKDEVKGLITSDDAVRKDLSDVNAFGGTMTDFEDGRFYIYDIVNDTYCYINGRALKDLLLTDTTVNVMSNKAYIQMSITAGSSVARIDKDKSFVFASSKVCINGLSKYPNIDYTKVSDTEITFTDYVFDENDVVVMEAYISETTEKTDE